MVGRGNMKELIALLSTTFDLKIGWLIVLALISGLVEISPIKLNPWSAIKNFFTANTKILAALENLDARVKNLEINNAEEKAVNARIRILRFGDEILHHINHTKEHYEQTMMDIDLYETYCDEHPDFKNQITIMNIQIIKEQYAKCLRGDSEFLPYYVK